MSTIPFGPKLPIMEGNTKAAIFFTKFVKWVKGFMFVEIIREFLVSSHIQIHYWMQLNFFFFILKKQYFIPNQSIIGLNKKKNWLKMNFFFGSKREKIK